MEALLSLFGLLAFVALLIMLLPQVGPGEVERIRNGLAGRRYHEGVELPSRPRPWRRRSRTAPIGPAWSRPSSQDDPTNPRVRA